MGIDFIKECAENPEGFSVSINCSHFHINQHMMGVIYRYVKHGYLPGSFLSAVISNDLKNAVGYANEENVRNLPAYVSLFYNHVPGICWGSEEKMWNWIKLKKEEREKNGND